MKPRKKLAAIVLISFMLVSLLSAASVFNVSAAIGDKPNPSGAYIKYTVDVNKPEGETLSYNYVNFILMDYVIQEGDVVEYDVYIGLDEAGWGAIDAQADTQWGEMRDSGAVDSDGNGIHTGVNIADYAFGQWYHRALLIGENDGLVGFTMEYFQICSHPNNGELGYQAYVLYDNIVITNNGQEKYVVFKDESHWPRAEKALDIVSPPPRPDPPEGEERPPLTPEERVERQLTLSHQKDCAAKMELLVFTQEDMDAFAAAEAAKIAELASIEASKAEADASREASREQASIDASIKQSEEEAAAAAAEAGGDDAAAEGDNAAKDPDKDDEGSSNMILIICIAGGGLVLVIVIVLIAVTGKKKKGPEEAKKD